MRRPVGAWRVLFSLPVAPMLAAAVIAGASTAHAAMQTEVADASEPDKSIDLNLDLRYVRTSHTGQITRELFNGKSTYDANELSYAHIRNTIELGGAIGLYHDLELHFTVPYVVSDSQSWQYAVVNGASVAPTSSIANNKLNANGEALATPAPLFAVPGSVNRGGFGDPTIGLAWGIFNEARDAHLPPTWYPRGSRTATWAIGLDYTIPVATPMDPSATQPGGTATPTLPIGLGEHRFDFWTSMSKRFGVVEPYFRLHYTLSLAAGNAYDNCSIAGNGANGQPKDPNNMIMSTQGQQVGCNPSNTDQFWAGRNKLEPSHVGGVMFGTEFHPIDHGKTGAGLSISLQFSGDYVSKGRNYSELSDVMQKLTYTDQYFSLEGRVTVDYRLLKYLHWVTFASLGTDTTHLLTSENVGIARSSSGVVNLGQDNPTRPGYNEVNPSYDFRTDVPGGRFKITSVSNFVFSTMLALNF